MTRVKADPVAVRTRREERRGAAFLMLVVMVVIVVLGATRSLLKNEIGANRASQQRIRHEIMLTAIERSRDVGLSNQLRSFPIDQAGEERIEVSLNQASGEISARWMRRGDVIDEMSRRIARTDSEKMQ